MPKNGCTRQASLPLQSFDHYTLMQEILQVKT